MNERHLARELPSHEQHTDCSNEVSPTMIEVGNRCLSSDHLHI